MTRQHVKKWGCLARNAAFGRCDVAFLEKLRTIASFLAILVGCVFLLKFLLKTASKSQFFGFGAETWFWEGYLESWSTQFHGELLLGGHKTHWNGFVPGCCRYFGVRSYIVISDSGPLHCYLQLSPSNIGDGKCCTKSFQGIRVANKVA